MATAFAAEATGSAATQPNDSTGIHRYKLAPPFLDGDYSKCQDWKHKLTAYMAFQHADCWNYLRAARRQQQRSHVQTYSQQHRTWMKQQDGLCQATWTTYWSTVAAAQQLFTFVRWRGVIGENNGFETFRVLHQTFSRPVSTWSIGYLTTLPKLKQEKQNFEECVLQRECNVARCEFDNWQSLPDTMKVAVLFNETKGALQQHLQLRAGQVITYAAMRSIAVEYYRATATLIKTIMLHTPSKTCNGPQLMEIGTNNNMERTQRKAKREQQRKKKVIQRQRWREKRQRKGYRKRLRRQRKRKRLEWRKASNKGKGKTPVCYKCWCRASRPRLQNANLPDPKACLLQITIAMLPKTTSKLQFEEAC